MTRILSFILALLIPLIVIVTQWQSGKYKEFMKTAREAEGQITFAENKVFDRKNNRKEFIINYEFTVSGQPFEGEERLEYADMEDRFTLGARVVVLYNPANPKQNHLKDLLERRMGVAQSMAK